VAAMLHSASLNITKLELHCLVQRGKEIRSVCVVNIVVISFAILVESLKNGLYLMLMKKFHLM
jgi:hypothetical protein